MTVGFQAFNDNGTIQFDTTTPNYAFVSKGTVTSNNDYSFFWPNGSHYFLLGIANTQTDIVVLRCNTSPVTLGSITNDGDPFILVGNNSSQVVDYWVFRTFATQSPIGNFGMELYNSDSTLAYSTAYKPLLVEQMVNVTLTSGYSNTISYPNASKEYGTCLFGVNLRQTYVLSGSLGWTGSEIPSGDPPNATKIGVKNNGTSMTLSEISGVAYTDTTINAGGVLTVNVTGY